MSEPTFTQVIFYRGRANGAEHFTPLCEPVTVDEELRTAIVHVTVSAANWPIRYGLRVVTFARPATRSGWAMHGCHRPDLHETAAIHDGTWTAQVS